MSPLTRCALSLLLLAPCSLIASTARADLTLIPSEVRRYAVPQGFDPASALITSTRAGATVIAATTGSEALTSCTVVFADDTAATAFSYRHNQRATLCLGVSAYEGGFFLRGADPTALLGEVSGFTALIDTQGNLRWTIDDRDLVEAASASDGGTGSFKGAYAGPHASLAYSPATQKLIAFTNGTLTIGPSERGITQAHVVDVETGRVVVSGQTFGPNVVGVLGDVVTRTSDGNFLLYLLASAQRGAFFYSYNGRNRISQFSPAETSWEARFITSMVYGPGERLTLLWTPEASADSDTRLTRVDAMGELLWESSWPQETMRNGGVLFLGRPLGLWVGASHSLILYLAGAEPFVRVVESSTGREVAVVGLRALTQGSPLGLLSGPDGTLKLLTLDLDGDTLREHALTVADEGDLTPADMGATPDMGWDMGAQDAMEPEVSAEDGCGCGVAERRAPGGLLLVLMMAGGALLRRATRADTPRQRMMR